MPVDTSGIHFWFNDRIKGHYFRLKKGRVVFCAEELKIDRSYEQHYNFVNVFVKMRDIRNGNARTFTEADIRYSLVECDRNGNLVS